MLNSGLIPLWSEISHCMISFLLNLLKCVLWPRMWFILVNDVKVKNVCNLLLLDKIALFITGNFLGSEGNRLVFLVLSLDFANTVKPWFVSIIHSQNMLVIQKCISERISRTIGSAVIM